MGQGFSIDLAIAFRNGNKGLDLDIGGTSVWNFNVGGNVYGVTGTPDLSNGGTTGWDFAQDSIFQLSVFQATATTIDVSLTRGSDVYTGTGISVGGAIAGFGLYVADTDDGNALNNLYANNMEIIAVPEPGSLALLGLGLGLADLVRCKCRS